jgi:uncharacterized membrane protein
MKGLGLLSLAVAAAAFATLAWVRGYPWQLALLAALAIGALVYVTGRTIQNMRQLSRSDRTAKVVWTPDSAGVPREDGRRGGQQQVGGAAQDPAGQQQDHPR